MNVQGLMQQAQKMQKKIMVVEEEFKKEKFNIEAGGGVVKIEITGDMKLTNAEISEELLNGEDIDMVQDLIVAAVNQGIDTVRKEKETRLSKVVGKLGGGMPGLF